MPFIDIGANLLDSMFAGVYRSRTAAVHAGDISAVLGRARASGVQRVVVTCGSASDARRAQTWLCSANPSTSATVPQAVCPRASVPSDEDPPLETYGLRADDVGMLYTTVGVHPTRALEFVQVGGGSESVGKEPEVIDLDSDDAKQRATEYMQELKSLLRNREAGRVVCIGEFGLDYDRLSFAPKDAQCRFFEQQLVELTEEAPELPLFFHVRNAAEDFLEIVGRHRKKFNHGIVHSFDGTAEEARRYLELGLFIGLNGCSLKTEDNLKVISGLPLDRILLETDAPWCDIRPGHAGGKHISAATKAMMDKHAGKDKKKHDMDHRVKGRNEPCTMSMVCDAVAAAMKVTPEQLEAAAFETTKTIFFPLEDQ